MSTNGKTRSNRRLAIALAATLGLGALGLTAPASADIGDITSCPTPTHGDIDCGGGPQDGPGDFTDADPDPEPIPGPGDLPDPQILPGGNGPDPEPEPEPEPEAEDLPDADVDGTVVADANFTG